jgi:hypothetical protein
MPPAVRRLLFVALLIPAILFGLIATPKLRPRRDSDASIPRHLRSVQVPTPQIPGLAEILVVSLPSAVERRKMIWDLAKLTGIRVEFVDAVGLGSVEVEMTRKRIPDVCSIGFHSCDSRSFKNSFKPTASRKAQRLRPRNLVVALPRLGTYRRSLPAHWNPRVPKAYTNQFVACWKRNRANRPGQTSGPDPGRRRGLGG